MRSMTFLKKKLSLSLALVMVLGMLTGCASTPAAAPEARPNVTEATVATTEAPTETTVPTEPPATTPADGNPDDITCKGSYTADDAKAADDAIALITVTKTETLVLTEPTEEGDEETESDAEAEETEPPTEIVTTEETHSLTNSRLQIFYWLEVAAYRQAGNEVTPDFDKPLDTQVCPLDDTVGSWQQYFLREALNTWTVAQALKLKSDNVPLGFEEAYQPIPEKHSEYFIDVAARDDYYGSHEYYIPNDLHQAYLDNIPALLESLAESYGCSDAEELAKMTAGVSAEELADTIALYNRGYMYLTEQSYHIAPTAEEVEAYFTQHEDAYAKDGITRDSGKYVNMRHILYLPKNATVAEDGTVTASENDWNQLYWSVQKKLSSIRKTYPHTEGVFATAAANNSLDAGSAMGGGLYENVLPGQLPAELDAWLFDEAREVGDNTIIQSSCGMHIVYYCSGTDIWYETARQDLMAQMLRDQAREAVELYPAQIDYSAIRITHAESPVLTADDLLYNDVSHERFPSAPLYLQQDYPNTKYGAYSIVTHGCGITTMAMIATYMSDTELTPPELCARYGRYCTEKGSDRTLYVHTPGDMGFYLKQQVFNSKQAKEALEQGYIVVGLQHEGFWTRGGHFLLLEKMNENGSIQVRDSNIYNYSKLDGHKIDEFDWATIPPNAVSFWIFYPKQTSNPMCFRCADGTAESCPDAMFDGEYLCGKCATALLRRNAYLSM